VRCRSAHLRPNKISARPEPGEIRLWPFRTPLACTAWHNSWMCGPGNRTCLRRALDVRSEDGTVLDRRALVLSRVHGVASLVVLRPVAVGLNAPNVSQRVRRVCAPLLMVSELSRAKQLHCKEGLASPPKGQMSATQIEGGGGTDERELGGRGGDQSRLHDALVRLLQEPRIW